MRLSESAVARAGLVAAAIALWRQGALLGVMGLLPTHGLAVALLVIAVLSGIALIVLAMTQVRAEKLGWVPFAVFGTVIFIAGYRDTMFKAASETMPTTDAHVYMDVAARFLLQGKNPYSQSLAEAFRVYQFPLSYSTPLLDADFTDRAAYPSLSFLVLVPAVLLHAPTYLTFTLAFVLGFGLLLWRAPAWARGLFLAPFVLDDTFLHFALGGITDTVWCALLVGAVLSWRKHLRWSAVLVGLACAYKQHPWFVVPYLLIRLWHERGELPWRGEARIFVGIVAGTFLALNLPFFIANPAAFFAGVTEPLKAPMVQLSDGLTVLAMTGIARMPRGTTSAIFWAAYAVTLVAYARHTRSLRDACWVFPALVLWLGYRALMSYWYLYAPVALAALLVRDDDADTTSDRAAGWWIDGALAGALGVAIVSFVVASMLRPAPFVLEIVPPLDTWGAQVFRLHVRVTSRLGHPTHPRFTVQSRSLQPMQWSRKEGPLKLAPGQTADYVLEAPFSFNEIPFYEGARVAVSDDGDPARRAFSDIRSDITARRITSLPNPDLTFIETRSGAPIGWGFERSDTSITLAPAPTFASDARLRIAFDAAAGAAPTAPDKGVSVVWGHLEPLKPATSRRAVLFTKLALPDAPITFHVNVPEGANRPPYDTVYGITLAVPSFRGAVLFGDAGKGTLPSGEPFVSLPAARGAWTTVTFRPRDVLGDLGATLRESPSKLPQAPYIDVPVVPMELGFLVTEPAGRAASVEIGRIEQEMQRPEDSFGRGTEAGYTEWRGQLSMDNENFEKAAEWFDRADVIEPTELHEMQAADAYLTAEDWRAAMTRYERAAKHRDLPAASKGLGFAALGAGDVPRAIHAFEHARDLFAVQETAAPRSGYLDSLRGLSAAQAKAGNCAEARRCLEMMKAEAPAMPLPPIPGCD